MDYYTTIIIVSFLSLLALSTLVYDNARFSNLIKGRFLYIYLTIFLAGLSEWLSIKLNGTSNELVVIHKFIKCADYTFTPIIPILGIILVNDNIKYIRILWGAVSINAVVHVISIFTGWTFIVDSHNVVGHGSFYPLYIAFTMLEIILLLYEFAKYSLQFKRRNRLSLYAALLPVCAGFIIQEAINSSYRTLVISMVITSAMIYIHFSEFTSQKYDDNISITRKLLDTDSMTGMYSRYHYSQIINELKAATNLPDDLIIFSIDINGLKETNDTYGHEAGDEIICGSAECIKATLGKYGQIFRIGGDEFVAILHLDVSIAYDLKQQLKEAASKWQGKTVKKLSLSIGYASAKERPEMNIDELLRVTDRYMYIDKKAFYSDSKNDRRSRT